MQPLDESDPREIGRYRLVGRLGAGGMGSVYLGRTPGGRPAAVKVISDHFRADPAALERFRREAETLRRVRSAYTAALIDASITTPPYWLATEYVPGPTLDRVVAGGGALPTDLCWALLAALAEGLGDIHDLGIWHRDVKPQNVILSPTGPQLIDFGISRSSQQSALTQAGHAMGTPGYTAPETLTHNQVGADSDVFALGATLAFAATGRAPYGEGIPTAIAYRTVHGDIDLQGVDPALAELISACVARDPRERPRPDQIVARCPAQASLVEHPAYEHVLTSFPTTTPLSTPPSVPVVPGEDPTVLQHTPIPPQTPSGPDAATTVLPAAVPPAGPLPATAVLAVPGGDPNLPEQGAPAGPARQRRGRRYLLAAATAAVVAVTAVVIVTQDSGQGDTHAKGVSLARSAPTDSGHVNTPQPDSTTAEGPDGAPSATPDEDPDASPPVEGQDGPDETGDVTVVNGPTTLKGSESVENTKEKLIMQEDGNLVVYDNGNQPVWASNTSGSGSYAVFQEDGNLVVYDKDDTPVWATDTAGHYGAVLTLQSDGNVVISLDQQPIWATGTQF
ncbi:protein kinase [Streptomyces sp. NPDC056161]|uniref:protein kinase domain-containing protein n=1 Tax=Streptomyces sp. NPDC056161 TaxID=3345732 RepID=UPI0035D5DDBE